MRSKQIGRTLTCSKIHRKIKKQLCINAIDDYKEDYKRFGTNMGIMALKA
jgi:hypothetical protein